MGVSGQLKTMGLPDLLQWAGTNRKSGVLALERNGVRRKIAFSEGLIVACSSDDPGLLGHYLVASGLVTRDALEQARQRQRETGKDLPTLLAESGGVVVAEVDRQLTLRAEETLYSLFEWLDASFRFEEDESLDASYVRIERTVDEILLNGLQRLDEIKMIRQAFPGSGMVLARTGAAPPPRIANSGMARRIMEFVDGRRPISEILVLSQASEFLVLKFLYHLYHKEVVQIVETQARNPRMTTLLDEVEDDPAESVAPVASDPPPPAPRQAAAEPARPETPPGPAASGELAKVAELLGGQIDFGAPAVAQSTVEETPEPPETLIEFEPTRVPSPRRSPEQLFSDDLPGEALYLYSFVDGQADLNEILDRSKLDPATLNRALWALVQSDAVELL